MKNSTNSRQVECVVRENLTNPMFSVDVLASELNLSPTSLREMVWMEYGMSPHHFIESIRLEVAARLLASGDKNIYLICRQAGYMHPRTFREAFKKRLHTTPSGFKQRITSLEDSEAALQSTLNTLWGRSEAVPGNGAMITEGRDR